MGRGMEWRGLGLGLEESLGLGVKIGLRMAVKLGLAQGKGIVWVGAGDR